MGSNTRLWRDPVVVMLISANEGGAAILVPVLLSDLDYPVALIGPLVASLSVTSLISRFPAGASYRPWRAPGIIVGVAVLGAVTSLLYPYVATVPALLLIVRLLHGLAFGTATTVNMAFFIDTLTPVTRARGMGLYGAGMAAGYTLGNTLAGFAADLFGYGGAFAVTAALWLIVIGLTLTDPRRAHVRPTPSATLAIRGQPPRVSSLETAIRALRDPAVVGIMAMSLALNAVSYVGFTYFPIVARTAGFSLAQIGLVSAVHSLTNTVIRPFAGRPIARFGTFRAMAAGFTLLVILTGFIPFAVAGGVVASAVLFMGIGSARATAFTANALGLAEDVPESRLPRGLASGMFNAFRDVGSLLGPLLGAALATIMGLDKSFIVGPLVLLAAYTATVWAVRTTARSVPDEPGKQAGAE